MLDASLPTESDLVSTHAARIREVRALINTIEENQADDMLPGLSTADNADTSPSVTGVVGLKTANAGATLITFFDDGYEGQLIVVIAGDANTTIQHDTGLVMLTTQANVKLMNGEALMFILEGGVWHEVGGYKRTTMRLVTDAAYQILVSDVALKCNAGANAITNTLPAANAVSHGHSVRVKKTDIVEANVVSTIRSGADTINGFTGAIELTLQNESVTFISDGVSDWTTFN
jgi:hypothetical protein